MKTPRPDQTIAFLKAVEATINLMDGETIMAYASALDDAARTHCLLILSDMAEAAGYDPTLEDMGQEDPDFRCYQEDAGADYVVMSCCRDHPWMRVLMKMPYSRDVNGVFTFGAHQIVQVKRTYEPVPEPDAALAEFVGLSLPAAEAVASPSMKQRKNLPAAAYAAPFFAGDDGAYKAGGTFQRSKSKLPFHVNAAKSVDSMETVDVPRLRNAMARFDHTDFASFGDAADAVKAKAKARLDKAAKALLPTVKAAAKAGEAVLSKMPGAPTKADADGFFAACEAFERSSISEQVAVALESLLALARRSFSGPVSATEAAEVQRSADAVLADALRLGVETPEIGKLRRRAAALSMARVHDVAEGRV